jgi:hypothetical protein
MTKIQTFQGIVVYDHKEKRFWKAKEIIELAKTFWNDAEMTENLNDEGWQYDGKPKDDDLAFIFREEFGAFSDTNNSNVLGYWDDLGRWEILEAPENIGFGIIEENGKTYRY